MPACQTNAAVRLGRVASLLTGGLFGLGLAGCSTDLSGDWDGDISCEGSGAVPMSLDIEGSAPDYDGVGILTGLVVDGVAVNVLMEIELHQPETYGSQIIEAEAICSMIDEYGNNNSISCEGVEGFGWDGADLLSAEVQNFLSAGLECELNLER